VKAVVAIIESRLEDPFSLDGLERVEADLIATVTAHGVIGNGGLFYWYEGKGAAITRRVAGAFDRMGLAAVANALRASLRAFSNGAPPEDLVARGRYLSAHREDLKQAFRELDETVWDADWEAAAIAYVEAHRAELAAIAPEYAAILQLH
jgi:Domain of unknown function (DUF4375)